MILDIFCFLNIPMPEAYSYICARRRGGEEFFRLLNHSEHASQANTVCEQSFCSISRYLFRGLWDVGSPAKYNIQKKEIKML